MKKRMPLRSLVAETPSRPKARSAARRTLPQKNRATETRTSPEVARSAAAMAALTLSTSIVFMSLRRL